MRKRPSRCRRCDRSDTEAGRISWGGLCVDCSTDAVVSTARQLADKNGPEHEKWKAAMERSYRERFGAPFHPGL